MNKELFIEKLKEINIDLNEKQLNLLQIYCDFLLEYNQHTNLTAIKDEKSVYLKHFYDSLTINKYIPNNSNLIDIGTGAGFPGMVLAIIRPDIKVTLLDSNNKKIKFLEELLKLLNISNVKFEYNRAESFAKNNLEKFDIVTSRAVSKLQVLSELSLPLLKVNGLFIAMKGNLKEELNESIDTIEILKGKIIEKDIFKLPIENSNRINIIIKKISSCPNIYPREYDKIIKYPLVKKS